MAENERKSDNSGETGGKDTKKLRVLLCTFGCQMNVRDSEVMAGLLGKAGYTLVDDEKKADVIIFNTCSVRQHAEDKVWSEIGRVSKRRTKDEGRGTKIRNIKPIIGLVGCMAQNYKQAAFERSPTVDFVVGPSDINKIPSILEKVTRSPGHGSTSSPSLEPSRAKSRDQVTSQDLFELKVWETDGKERPEEIYHTGFYEDKDHAYVVISEGCSNYCSYCVVPFVRGELHNRKAGDIIREIEQAVKNGINRITLLGQNVNAYPDFAKLLKTVDQVKGLKKFTFVTSHPKDTSMELFKMIAECEKLRKNLHLPVQSGSDRILELMSRGYTREKYLDLVKNYRSQVPSGAISTDIIVGFPTETEKDFSETYDLMKEIGFDAAYIFKYSPRPRTQAQHYADDVPKEEKERRHKVLLDYQKERHSNKKRKGIDKGK